MIYLVDLASDTNGTLLVTCPSFPEVTTFGEDKAQAWRNAMGAIEEAIAARIADGDDLPRPATASEVKKHKGLFVTMSIMTALKAQLYISLRASGMTRAELARRLGWHREQVDRLFRLDHASRVNQFADAFAALNQEVDIRVREMA